VVEPRHGRQKPDRIRSVCTEMVKVCPSLPLPHREVKSKRDKCNACQGVVSGGAEAGSVVS